MALSTTVQGDEVLQRIVELMLIGETNCYASLGISRMTLKSGSQADQAEVRSRKAIGDSPRKTASFAISQSVFTAVIPNDTTCDTSDSAPRFKA